jgi:hypothetical protein
LFIVVGIFSFFTDLQTDGQKQKAVPPPQIDLQKYYLFFDFSEKKHGFSAKSVVIVKKSTKRQKKCVPLQNRTF